MRRLSHLVSSALVVTIGVTGLVAQVHAADTAANSDKTAIEALEKRFADALNAKDLDAIMKVYAPARTLFVFDVGPPRQHVGWQDYKADWQQLLASFPGPITFSVSDLSITTAGSVAYGHSIQTLHSTRPNGSKFELVVRVTDVYQKIHGEWLIVQEHVSVPVDLDSGKADLLSKP